MTEQPIPSAAPVSRLRRVFPLSRPIRDEAGTVWHEIELAEPELGHLLQAQRTRSAKEAERTTVMISLLANAPLTVVRRVRLRDAEPMRSWIKQTTAAPATPADDNGTGLPGLVLEPERTFVLAGPLPVGSGALGSLTLRQPDLRVAVAVDGARLEAEKTLAMLAALSGVPAGSLLRITLRDLAAIEAWIAQFLARWRDLAAATPDSDGRKAKVGAGWRDVAVTLARQLATPLPDVLSMPLAEAADWAAALRRSPPQAGAAS